MCPSLTTHRTPCSEAYAHVFVAVMPQEQLTAYFNIVFLVVVDDENGDNSRIFAAGERRPFGCVSEGRYMSPC